MKSIEYPKLTIHICTRCGTVCKGFRIKCPKCGGETLKVYGWEWNIIPPEEMDRRQRATRINGGKTIWQH